MKTIKLFEEFNDHSKIDDICEKYGIINYTINKDMSIDVDDNIDLRHEELNKLPLKFNKVNGNFYCNNNYVLTTLEGSPKEIVGDFDCSHNQLTSLEGCPTRIGGEFYCDNNPVYEVWKLIYDKEYLELFLDYDIIRDGNVIILDRLNDLLDMIGRPKVTEVKGYTCI